MEKGVPVKIFGDDINSKASRYWMEQWTNGLDPELMKWFPGGPVVGNGQSIIMCFELHHVF